MKQKEINNDYSVQVLLSAMNLTDCKLQLKQMNINESYVIINQTTNKISEKIEIINEHDIIISSHKKGLSKSRNMAIKYSDCDIGIIADDDMVYYGNYKTIIRDSYKKYPDADLIVFAIDYEDKSKYKKKFKEGKISYFKALRISSVQITFKIEKIKNKGIVFDEDFGSGSIFKFGEDNIFMYDCLRNKLKIYYIPVSIGILKEKHASTWFNGIDKGYLENRGASYYRMSPAIYKLLIMQFAIRKKKMFRNKYSTFFAMQNMNYGAKKYKRYKKNELKILFVGDFKSNTGPAIANKNIEKVLKNKAKYTKCKSRIFRIIEMYLKALNVEHICFCSLSKIDIYGIKLAKKMKKSTSYIMHGYSKLEQKYNGSNEKNKILQEEFILQNVDKVFCVSKKFMDYMKKQNLKVNFQYVYNGIDWENICLNKNLKINKSNNKIMSTGGGMPQKNNLIVCEAIKRINNKAKENNKIEYIIVGKGYGNEKQLREYNFVKYYEELEHEECLKKMAECNLYIQNSSFETFGISPFEALANGCGVLLSKNIGCIDLLKNINDLDLIKNVKSIEEIEEKIKKNIDISNNNRIYSKINFEETGLNNRVKELINKIKEN